MAAGGEGPAGRAAGLGAIRQAVRACRGAGHRGGSGRAGCRRGRARRGDRVARGAACSDADPARRREGVLADTTALGVYDHGYVTAVAAPPDAADRGSALAHPRRPDRDRDRRHRAADRLRRQRPARDHARERGRDATSSDTASGPGPGRRLHEQRQHGSGGRGPARGRGRDRRRGRCPPGGVGARHGRRRRRSAGFGRDRTGRWRPRDRRCGPAPGLGRLEPQCLAVEPGPRHAPVRRADRRLRPGPARTARAPWRPSVPSAGDIAALGAIEPAWIVPPAADDPGEDAWATHYVDLQRDATARDLHRALGAGLTSIEHVKRYTTIGTAADQGKTSGVVASAIAAAILGQEVGAVGVPTYRPPVMPVSFAPARRTRPRATGWTRSGSTPIHDWHVAHGRGLRGCRPVEAAPLLPARWRDRWRRRSLRECAAARTGVAVMDATTLGKIDLQGPDAGGLPRPRVHEHVLDAQGRGVPVRRHVPGWTGWSSTTA